jgi:methylthioribose-1-phosphate isomerase
MRRRVSRRPSARAPLKAAAALADDDVATNPRSAARARRSAGGFARTGRVVVLTHCNAGWLATVDSGGLPHGLRRVRRGRADPRVVDETRPRNQGARLTAFEIKEHGVPCTIVADNAGGHLMQHGRVDLCFVGADRVTATGDVANKVGTYLKALAARDNGVPFHVAAPGSTIDFGLSDGVREIPIEERAAAEVTTIEGVDEEGAPRTVRIAPEGVAAANPAFDVTPARLVTSIVTERGLAPATRAGLASLFPERSGAAGARP